VTAGAVGVAAVVAIAVVLIDHRSSPSSQPGGQARPILYTVRGVGLRIGSAKALRIGLVSADGARAHLLPQLNILCCIGEALSPDGRRVALSEEHALYTVAADGTDARTVYASPTSTPSVIAWSPDGTRIAFSTESALDVIRPDGTGLRQIAAVADVTALAWSPRGDRIAYLTKGRPEILAVSATGGQVATLYGRDQRDPAMLIPTTLSWAPGRAILFGATSQRVVWSYTLGAPRATRALVGADQASWGPDGRTFAALVGGRIVLDVPGEPHGPPIGPSGILSISWG